MKRIVTNFNILRMWIQIDSEFYFCVKEKRGRMTRLFLIAPIAQKLLRQYASCARFDIEGLHLHMMIKWWEQKEDKDLTYYYYVAAI